MNDLIMFYSLINATNILPFLYFILCYFYSNPIALLARRAGDVRRVNRILRMIGITRMEGVFHLLPTNFTDPMMRLSLVVAVLQVITAVLNIVALNYGQPSFFVGNLNDLPEGIMSDLMRYAIVAAMIHAMALVLIFMVIIYKVPMPFVSPLRRNRTSSSAEMERLDNLSQDFASIRLTRFKTGNETYIFARCHREDFASDFNVVFCQKTNGQTDCFTYNRNEHILAPVIPAPITVNELEEIFDSGEN